METDRFRGYRVPSARHPVHAYDVAAAYLVTVCVAGREPLLGGFDAGCGVRLSRLGHLVTVEWHRTAILRPGVWLDAFVVMPGHLHAVLRLGNGVGLADVVRHAKGSATRAARRLGLLGATDALWQTRYHDRILRTSRAHAAACAYVIANPTAPRRDAS